jgi:hypothetical protein
VPAADFPPQRSAAAAPAEAPWARPWQSVERRRLGNRIAHARQMLDEAERHLARVAAELERFDRDNGFARNARP